MWNCEGAAEVKMAEMQVDMMNLHHHIIKHDTDAVQIVCR